MTAKKTAFEKACEEVVALIEEEGETQLASILRERLAHFRERADAEVKRSDPDLEGDQEQK